MTLRIITSWNELFRLARAEGVARLAYKDYPDDERKLILDEAILKHDAYRDLCLEADEMVGLEGML